MVSFLQIDKLTKSFGDLVLYKDLTFGIFEGQRVGLIAKNGAGKTTLLNIISGKEGYDSGNIVFRNGVKVGYLEQDPVFEPGLTVLQACLNTDSEVVNTIRQYEEALTHNRLDVLDELIHKMDHLNAWDYELRIKQILSQLKINNFDQKVETLSGGQRKRVAMANVLISEPELLILDEPTNHLDLEMIEWLEGYLNRSRLALLMVTHDRYFLDRVCNEIFEIDNKQIYSYKGNYSYYLDKRAQRVEAMNSEIDRANNLLKTELDWIRRQPQARGTKAKYRVDAFYELEEKAKKEKDLGNVKLNVKSSYIGSKIFEAEHVFKSFDDLKILEDFNYVFARYEKMGIVGNNGTGKSTFIKILMGEVQPDKGIIDIGETVKFGYYSQDGLKFDDKMKVIDVIREVAEEISLGDGSVLSASQFLQYFLFTPETQHNYVYKLSGGEKRRLYLCQVLMSNPNFLVLDEPTNDLDIVTLNVLEEYLKAFKGCVIVVSHDRYFMDKLVDNLMVFRGNGELKDFPGNYSDYREWKEIQEDIEKKQLNEKNKEVKKQQPQSNENKPPQKRKLSFKETKELEELNIMIPQLEEEKRSIEEQMSSGTLSTDELLKKSDRISEIIEMLEEKEKRWLELSDI